MTTDLPLRGLRLVLLLMVTASLGACATVQTQRALSTARSQAKAGDLEGAHATYLRILAAAPTHASAQGEIEEVRDQLGARATQAAEAKLAEHPESMASVREARAILDAAALYDPAGARLGSARGMVNAAAAEIDAANAARAGRARAAAKTGAFAEANEELAAIRAVDAESPEIAALTREIGLAQMDLLVERVEADLGRGDLSSARATLAELEALGVDPTRVAQVRSEFTLHEIEILREQVGSMIEGHRYYRAFVEINDSGRGAELGTLVDTLRREGSSFYANQARLRLERGENDRAYLEAVKGLELDRSAPGLFESHRDARDQVQAGLQIYIAVPTFGAPREQPDLGSQFSDALISHLFRVLPYGIHIIEREKIDMLMREQGFAELGNMMNVSMIVSGNVSLMKIDRRDREHEAVARVEVGSRIEANPAYEAALRVRANAPSAGTSSKDTSAAKPVELPPLPEPTISIPEYESIRYKRGSSTVKGFATVAARVFDTSKGSITYAQEFNARFETVDEFQDAVDGAGIEGDPLELPTDTEVSEALRTKLVTQLADLIRSQFDDRVKGYLEEARYYLARREADRAMAPLARGFLYGVQAQVPANNPDYAALVSLIVDETERDFLPGRAAANPGVGQ